MLLPRVEDVHLYRERTANDVEKGARHLVPDVDRGEAKRIRDLDESLLPAACAATSAATGSTAFSTTLAHGEPGLPQLLLGQQAVGSAESLVLEAEQAAVLQVGGGHPPAALQVAVEEVLERAAQGVLGALPGRAAHVRVRRVVVEARVHGVEHRPRQVAVAQPERLRSVACAMQCRSQQGDLHEVVEVACLQGGVLSVVGEAQELAGLGEQVPVALHRDERLHCEDGGGGAPVVDPERRQLEPLRALAPGVGHPARRLQAEQEVAANQRRRRALTLRNDPSSGVDEDGLRNVLAGVGANPLDALRVGLLEGIGQAFQQRGAIGAGPGRFVGEMQVRVLAAVAVVGAAVLPGKQPRTLAVLDCPHTVVLGPAPPAEDEGVEGLVRLAGLGRLLRDLQVAVRRGLERRPHGVSPGQELVQPEREDGKPAGIVLAQLRSREEPLTEDRGAAIGVGAGELREIRGGARLFLRRLALRPLRRPSLEPPGHLPEELAGAGLLANPERRLDPRRQRMTPERLVVRWGSVVGSDGGANGAPDRRVRRIDRRGRAFQRFADDLLGREVHAEQRPGHLGDLDPLVFAAAAARHGGGRADADNVVAEGVAAPADEHRNVGALAAAIGVQLVEHEEPEPPGGSHQLAVLAAREQQLQHHVVREQDVGRIPPDRLSGLSSFLPGIAGKPNGAPAFRVAPVDELPELLALAVGERVHRVDDDGPDAAAGPAPEHVVHDGHDVGEALPGAGAGGQHVGSALPCLQDCLALMLVQEKLLAAVVGVGLADPEDAGTFLVEYPELDQVVDGAAGRERRVELEERLRPESLRLEHVVDEPVDPRIADLDEAPRIAPVVADQAAPEVEDVHVEPPCHTRVPPGSRRLRRRGAQLMETIMYQLFQFEQNPTIPAPPHHQPEPSPGPRHGHNSCPRCSEVGSTRPVVPGKLCGYGCSLWNCMRGLETRVLDQSARKSRPSAPAAAERWILSASSANRPHGRR